MGPSVGLDEFEARREALDTGCPLSPLVERVVPPTEEVGGGVAPHIGDEGEGEEEKEEDEDEEEDSDTHFKRKRKDTSSRGAPKKKKKKAAIKIIQSSFARHTVALGAPFVEQEGVPLYILVAISFVVNLLEIGELTGEIALMLVSGKGGLIFLHFHSSHYRELISFIFYFQCRRRI